MNVLVVGNGGREHALAWKLAQSPKVTRVYVAPGNAGTMLTPKTQNIAIAADAVEALVAFAKDHDISLTVIGPEAPLALGIVDAFNQAELACFGPTQAAAQLESSKAFCKDFMQKYNIPTAQYRTFTDAKSAHDYVSDQPLPIVIKASGLAAGKGVVIAETSQQAHAAIDAMMQDKQFGQAGAELVIEAFLTGTELSFICVCDGNSVMPLASSQDHKRRDDNDQGPNTGGMGAFSPSPLMNTDLEAQVLEHIIYPTLQGMKQEGIEYTGFLYAGLMIDSRGQAQVLEYNCRMGDPETQPIMMRLQSDLADMLMLACHKQLDQYQAQWDSRVALGVVMASGGYPSSYNKGDVISGLDDINESLELFHAGTAIKDKAIVSNGGRVLAVCSLANNLKQARNNIYKHIDSIHWQNCFYRKDIGAKACDLGAHNDA